MATIWVFGIEPNLTICPLPLYPTPIRAILILSNLGAIKSPIYFPFDSELWILASNLVVVRNADEIAVVFKNLLLS